MAPATLTLLGFIATAPAGSMKARPKTPARPTIYARPQAALLSCRTDQCRNRGLSLVLLLMPTLSRSYCRFGERGNRPDQGWPHNMESIKP